MGFEIFEKLRRAPAEITDAEVVELGADIDKNLNALGERKDEILSTVSRMIEEAKKVIQKAETAKDETAKKSGTDRLALLQGVERQLIAAGAKKGVLDSSVSGKDAVEVVGATGVVAASNVEMTVKNLGLFAQKHPWITLGGMLALPKAWKLGTAELNKKPWYVRWPAKAAAALAGGIGLNMLMQRQYPGEAATLEKKKPYDERVPEPEPKVAA